MTDATPQPVGPPALRELRAQLRAFAVGAAAALLVATIAFVVTRNRDLAASQLDLAERAAADVADGRSAPPTVTAVVVGPATATHRPYLRQRQINSGQGWRRLGAGAQAGLDEKLFYDAATQVDRDGPFAELVRDGSGRALAGRRDPRGVVLALTAPASPAPFPLLVLIGVLGLGAALAAAGRLLGGVGATAGLALGVAALAVPTSLWGAPIATVVIALIAVAVTWAEQRGRIGRFTHAVRRDRVALGFLAPAAVAMLVLVGAPFVIGILLGFYDHHHGTWTFVGLSNFGEILSGGGRPLDDPLNFWFIFGVTVLWTLVNVALHVSIGVALALLLSRTWLRGKGVFRMLLILPWAIPNYITALIWHAMFEGEYGALNSLLHACGLSHVSWLDHWATAFSANVVANTWLGFPFMMVVALGAIESVPRDYYEAAAVDGASAWQQFRHITLPHLRPALGPAVALGAIWTFNNFNVIYLVSGGKPGGATNILVTDAYRWAFQRGERYGMAAAYATIIFLILLLWTVFGNRIVRSKEPS